MTDRGIAYQITNFIAVTITLQPFGSSIQATVL